jgi:PKD repeat protein
LNGTGITQYTLRVLKTGTGTGSVTSVPDGISCGLDCSEPYYQVTQVVLSASADPGSTFTGWSGGGCSGTGTCNVTVDSSFSVTAAFGLLPPTADFSGVPLSDLAPMDVTFTDLSTNDPTSWSWTFGDGGTSAAQNPVHTYQDAGTYSVSLTASNAGGQNTMTKTNYITVACPVLPVKVPGSPLTYYSSLQAGYDAAASGEVVQVHADTFAETMLLHNDDGHRVTLKGGMNQCFTSNAGAYTTVVGQITISSPVVLEHIVIQHL